MLATSNPEASLMAIVVCTHNRHAFLEESDHAGHVELPKWHVNLPKGQHAWRIAIGTTWSSH